MTDLTKNTLTLRDMPREDVHRILDAWLDGDSLEWLFTNGDWIHGARSSLWVGDVYRLTPEPLLDGREWSQMPGVM